MDFTPNPSVDLDGAAEVTLGGKTFKIPILAWRCSKKILRMLPSFNEIVKKGASTPPEPLSESDYDILLEMIQIGVSACYPEVSVAVLSDLPLTVTEFLPAVNVVMAQTHSITRAVPGEV